MKRTFKRILGIDPGSRTTGYGVIDVVPGRGGINLSYVTSGCIKSGNGEMPERLGVIYRGVSEIVAEYQPEAMAIEQVFLAKNPNSALKLGQARGVAIAAAVAAELSVAEYAAREVKLAVTGTGAAAKPQVQHMVRVLLQLAGTPAEDAADALAIAICHVNTSSRPEQLSNLRSGSDSEAPTAVSTNKTRPTNETRPTNDRTP